MHSTRPARWLWVLALPLLTAGGIALLAEEDSPWKDEDDAVVAAPDSHRILLENDSVRVLEVVLRAGEREPPHTHRWPSVMVGLESARIRYYDAQGEIRFETPEGRAAEPTELGANWLRAEPLHAVENIDDDRTFRALRVELKGPPDS